jgi:hypothetical protein
MPAFLNQGLGFDEVRWATLRSGGMEPSETVMNVPYDLVPKIQELIAKQQS